MTYNNCVKDIIGKLSSLPPKWAEKIACNICGLISAPDTCDPPEESCDAIRDCQTVTSMGNFIVDGNTICITYKDERDIQVKRCFEFSSLTDEIDETDGSCLTNIWGQLSPTEKWQRIIDKVCDCCHPTTTTTTTSTTTTTTIAPCNDCWTLSMYNSTQNTQSFTYKECGNPNNVNVILLAGESIIFCACPGNVVYNSSLLILTVIANTCIPCTECHGYVLTNNNIFPSSVSYNTCPDLLPVTAVIPAGEKLVIQCACADSLVMDEGITIDWTLPCPSITPPSTTTTTTLVPECRCYRVTNGGGEGSPSRWLNYLNCYGVEDGQGVPAATTIYVCALKNTISGYGLTIINMGLCDNGCDNTITTTTTTTSTTTTTTIAPITTTTTTTSTSTTTTTTAAPTNQNDYVYFANSSTLGDTGAKIWFSQQDYYTPNTPASLVAANCLSIADLGPNPPIYVTVNFWKDNINPSIDNGGGGIRAADGTKTVTIDANLLVYNGSTGAWGKSSGIFLDEEGVNIAAFQITGVTTSYTIYGINHIFQLPPYHHFIRVHNTFNEGSTGVIWFDL